MSLYYDITEYSTAVKPFVFSYLFNEHSPQSATYIDPDIQFFGCLEPCELAGAGADWDCVVTPHILTDSLNESQHPTLQNIRTCGAYNFGFVHFENTPSSKKVLNFWKRKLTYDSLIWFERNLFTDQRFGDMFPSLCRVRVNRNPALNVAYWNLQERTIYYHTNGSLHVRLYDEERAELIDQSLIFFHYSSLQASGLLGISKHQGTDPRSTRGSNKTVLKIISNYERATHTHHQRISELGTELPRCLIGALSYASHGQRQIRELIQHERRAVNRFYAAKSSMDMAMLPPSRFINEQTFLLALHGITDQKSSTTRKAEFNVLEAIGIQLPGFKLKENPIDALHAGEPKAEMNVIGYPNFTFGVGQVTQLILRDISRSAKCFSFTADPARSMPVLDGDLNWIESLPGLCRFNPDAPSLFLVNADQLLHYVNSGIAHHCFSRVSNLGYWWWELERPVPAHAEAAKYLDKVLAPTRFIYDSLAQVIPKRKLVYAPLDYRALFETMEPQASPKQGAESDQDFLYSLGLDINISQFKTITLSIFDFRSCLERKNPAFLIDLFSAPEMKNQALILKCSGGASFADQYLNLIEQVALTPNVFLLDSRLSLKDLRRLISTCHIYASPHRSEGLGLNIIQADACGLATIFTNYGGITEYPFFGHGPHRRCSFSLVEIGEQTLVYRPYIKTLTECVSWAEPDRQCFLLALLDCIHGLENAHSMFAKSLPTEQMLTVTTVLNELLGSNQTGPCAYQSLSCKPKRRQNLYANLPTLGDAKRQIYLACRQLFTSGKQGLSAMKNLLSTVALIPWIIIKRRTSIRRRSKSITAPS